MTKPDALDQSWGFADPDVAKQHGIDAVMMYLSPTPSKNATAAKIKAYLKVGIGVWFGWESTANRALQGAAAGEADGREAARQLAELIRQVGRKPGTRLAIYFAVDFDTNPSQYPALDAYLTAAGKAVHAAGFDIGVYAEADYVEHTAGRKLTDAEWQTYAWSGGRVAAVADVLQYLNGQTLGGASVDFNTIRHEHALGAWWPADHPNNTPKESHDVSMSADEKKLLESIDGKLDRVLDLFGAKGESSPHHLPRLLDEAFARDRAKHSPHPPKKAAE